MRHALVIGTALLLCGLISSCSRSKSSGKKVVNDSPVLKIAVSAAGNVLIDGKAVTIDELRGSFKSLSEARGVVWYYRENPAGEPPPQAMQVMEAIVQYRLPVRMSSKPDYSDAIGPDGKSH